jgi:hypothetical protein
MSNRADTSATRRTVLAGMAVAGAVSMSRAGGAVVTPATPGFEFAFEAIVEIGPAEKVGTTPYGERNRIPITGGTFAGPRIKGVVLPGGADWQLVRKDGSMTLDADYMIQAEDGALIHVHNRGVVSGTAGTSDFYLRTAPIFEAPVGSNDWLNKAVFVGTVEPVTGRTVPAVCVRVFKVT